MDELESSGQPTAISETIDTNFLPERRQGRPDRRKNTRRVLVGFLPIFLLILAVTAQFILTSDNAEMMAFQDAERHTVLMQAAGMERKITDISSDLAFFVQGRMAMRLWDDEGDPIPESLSYLARDFLEFGTHRRLYDQIRLLDATGMELVRVNFNNGHFKLVSQERLQNKKERYYFADAFRLNRGEVFISPLDLNIEGGEIEQPLKPMIRFASPVFDQRGKKRGIILFNYFAEKLLKHFADQMETPKGGQAMLLNADGYWLKGTNSKDEWGFMYADRRDRTFAKAYPEAWKRIKSNEALQFETSKGLFTFRTVYPLLEGQRSSTGRGEPFVPSERQLSGKGYHWKIVSFVPSEILYSAPNRRHTIAIFSLGLLGLAMFIGIWWITASFTTGRRLKMELCESEKKYRTLYENAPLSYQSLNEDGYFKDVNPMWLETLGYAREEVIGKWFGDFLHPDWKVHFEKNFLESKRRGCVHDVQFKIRRKDGRYLDVSFEGIVGNTPEGKFKQTYCVFQDITEQKKSQEALRGSEEKLKTLLNATSDMAFLAESDGTFIAVNDALAKSLGRTKDELIGSKGAEYVSAETATKRMALLQEILTQKKSRRWEEDHAGRCFVNSVYPVFDDIGNVKQIACFAKDITEQKRVETERNQLLHDSGERIKELRCMYALAESIRTRDKLEQVFEDTVALIPPGWQYPEKTCARVCFDDSEFVSKKFEETEWKQSADIVVDGVPRGTVDIFCLEELPESDEGPFLKEERELINGIANNLSEAVAHVQSVKDRGISERQLRHAQKMEGIGQMAGGIAHDFNNILSIIVGNLGFLKHQATGDEQTLELVNSANRAAMRAADLTKQLLRFSRKQVQETHPININQVIQGMESLITRAITPAVEVEHLFTDDLWLTEINSGDFEDALLNLIINARDAMPGGGQLTLETCNCTLDSAYCAKNPGSNPGEYVQLSVSDNGDGIAPELQERIFEPFFTTKEEGRGTGLGLAMVFGFTKCFGGYVEVCSEQKIGTTFRLYLPRMMAQVAEPTVKVKTDQLQAQLGGKEVILAVDDEEGLLGMAKFSLEKLGYRVLTARNGQEALERLAEEPAIDLLFSDVVMPGGLNGYELAEKATASRPNLKVLLTSGFTEKTMIRDDLMRFGANLLSKPYAQSEIAQRIRDLLDE
ncbi:MAG: PAS domain S-box protein [Gammaproteobacteria bacterium]|nr:PAS domain S-box protein [Gammaproteobacteria bacterium]